MARGKPAIWDSQRRPGSALRQPLALSGEISIREIGVIAVPVVGFRENVEPPGPDGGLSVK